jgi:hypothetical protein
MEVNKKKWKPINILLRLLGFPFILGLILVKYNAHAIINSICFLFHGGEWITYAQEDRTTIQDIYLKLKENNKNKK